MHNSRVFWKFEKIAFFVSEDKNCLPNILVFLWKRHSLVRFQACSLLNLLKLKYSISLISYFWNLPWTATVMNYYPANIYLFKVNNINTTKRYEIFSKLTVKRRKWRRSDLFIVYFEHIAHLFLVFLLFTVNK